MKALGLKKEVVAVFSYPVLARVKGGDASGEASCACKTVQCSVSPCDIQSETVLVSHIYTECCAVNFTDTCDSDARGICEVTNRSIVDECSFKP